MLISSMTQTTEKWDSLVLSRADFLMVKGAMVFCVFIFIFLFRSNGKKSTWMRTIFVTVMVIILKMSF